MRRAILVLAACAVTSLAGVSTAQAASVTSGGSGGAARASAPKATKYHLNVYTLSFERYNEATVLLYNKTKTWETPGYCDAGPFTKVGKKLTLSDSCTGDTWNLTKVKPPAKNTYFGPFEGSGGPEGYVELIKE